MDLTTALQRRLAIATLNAPAPLLRALAGPPRRSPDGLTLDLQTQVLLHLAEKTRATEWHALGVPEGRRLMAQSSRLLSAFPSGVLSTRDMTVPVVGSAIPVRIYTPEASPRPLPMVVYYHGGGFVLGSIETHDGECRALALGAGAIVVSVEYRLAPEHRFPIAVDDCLAAYRWVVEQAASLDGDARRIAIAGDSAGGNLAAVVARETRGEAAAPVFQLLIYPAVDFTRSFPSHRFFRKGFMLTEDSINWFTEHYLAGADPKHPRSSPLFAEDHAGGPPALILTAGFDPLRDEAKAYAEKLEAAGVPVEYRCFEGLVHGFFSMSGGLAEAKRALDLAVDRLRRALSPRG